jgi:hypothetical protein
MKNLKLLPAALAIACAALATPASAQNARSWVSSTGADASSCLRGAPCATFAGAIAKTVIGGLISCADTGDYGAPTITQSVTIDCGDGLGTSAGIVINIPSGNPNDQIRSVGLRGLTVAGIALSGIEIIAAGAVKIDHVYVPGNFVRGVYDHRSDSSGVLLISNSLIENNTLGVLLGSVGSVQAVLDNVRMGGNNYGMAASPSSRVVVRGSVFSGNTTGIEGDTNAQIVVERSTVSHNSTGIESNSSVRLSNSDIAFNTSSVQGTIATFGNNRFSGNTVDGGTLVPVGTASSDLGER